MRECARCAPLTVSLHGQTSEPGDDSDVPRKSCTAGPEAKGTPQREIAFNFGTSLPAVYVPYKQFDLMWSFLSALPQSGTGSVYCQAGWPSPCAKAAIARDLSAAPFLL